MEQESDFAMVNRAVPQKGSRELKVEDALLYLDQVKMEFSDQPKIYNEFLEIMKNFKAQSITTPGVIDQVKQLFKGHNKLILGFNTFLPEGEGYKIELTPEEEAYPQYMQQQLAINYVTNIRNRFADEPEIYQSFLKILHTYQREQNGVKNVLDQVSALFVDHPDLLMEFAYFLPDSVQDQAKERLKRAVEEAELRKLHRGRNESLTGRRNQETKASKSQQVNETTNLKKRRRAFENNTSSATNNSNSSNAVKKTVQSQLTTERRFFDQVREVLSSQSPEIWNEFVKCLDLYNRGAINRRGLILLVTELFGPQNSDILDELKALLSARSTYDASQQMDLWHSIPLNEIDFSQCRRCTPSYRVLPGDYMRPICSARIDYPESAVLNDDWVSLPIGSEESSSFKAKRKNQYEEALFRSEDDRYDIDMIIDSNSSCIRILEPIAEEIATLKAMEERDGTSPRFSMQLERSNLSTIHLNVISRIYGDHGAEILELLRRNPAGAIPIILKRLKQKDLEWRKARQQLNSQWRDILVKNAARSLDHRSADFRQQDKRSYSTRHLVNDIKESNSNNLNPGVSYTCDLTTSQLCPDMNPNLYLVYPNKDQVFLRIVYKLLCHAANNSNCSAIEKEKIGMLWKNLFRVVFNMPVHYLFNAESTISSNSSSLKSKNNRPIWPIGTLVLTLYGIGSVKNCDQNTGIHEVQLSFGKSYLPYSSILGAESLSEAATEKIGVTLGQDGQHDSIKDVSNSLHLYEYRVNEPCHLFYGTQMCYVFLRLHHILTYRLKEAYELAKETEVNNTNGKNSEEEKDNNGDSVDGKYSDSNENNDLPYLQHPISENIIRPALFSQYMDLLYAFIDGRIDLSSYEDSCRSLLGNKSYILHTLDKIVQQCIKCLQALSSDDITAKLIGIFIYHRLTPNGTNPVLYQNHVNVCLRNTLEEVYRLQFVTSGQYDYEANTVLVCQYLGSFNNNNSNSNFTNNGNNGNSNENNSQNRAPQLVLDDDEDDSDDGAVHADSITTAQTNNNINNNVENIEERNIQSKNNNDNNLTTKISSEVVNHVNKEMEIVIN